MNSPYQYCSRCGDELEGGVREYYEAPDQRDGDPRGVVRGALGSEMTQQ